jgi:hypothetical protein
MPELFGTVQGSFFRAPEWVDTNKPAGTTSASKMGYTTSHWWKKYLTTQFFFLSPNLLWFTISVAVYILFPYDLESAKVCSF